MQMITYRLDHSVSAEQFIDILNRSGLAERRPVDDPEMMEGMVDGADIIITASDEDKIVGIARAMSDLHYCCYLSDLAVDKEYQRQGIGKKMIEELQKLLGPKCKIILLSAPDATEYYPKIGFTKHESAWTLTKGD